MAGDIFKKRREDLGLNIREISEKLRINADYLSAIESECFEKLPAPVYTMGYIKSYAGFLKIESESIIEFYKGHLAQPTTATVIPVGYSKKKTSKTVYFILLVFAALIFVAGPYLKSRRAETGVPGSHTKEMTASSLNGGEKEISKIEPAKIQSPVPHAGNAEKPGHSMEKPESKSLLAATEIPKETASAPKAEHNLNIIVSDKTWIAIKFGNGKKQEMILQPGAKKTWKFSERALLKIGNAGGIRLNLDGRDMGSPGSDGEVKILSLPGDQNTSG